MPGPSPTPIVVSKAERDVLEGIIRRSNSPNSLVKRARIVLFASDGIANQEIARRLFIGAESVRRWRKRWMKGRDQFRAEQLDASIIALLSDEARPGSPVTFSAEQVTRIVALGCEDPRASGREVSHWSPRELAEEAVKRGIVESISPRSVGRFLKNRPT